MEHAREIKKFYDNLRIFNSSCVNKFDLTSEFIGMSSYI